MRISSVRLFNFKRFTDLLVRDIPITAKLVVVVGPNGCGKSSLFDAFLHWYRLAVGLGIHNEEPYFRKDADRFFGVSDAVKVTLHAPATLKRGCFYIRTAYRNDPDFSIAEISKPNNPSDNLRINRVIENDQTVSDNYRRLVYDTTAAIFDHDNDTKLVAALREELIGQIQRSMQRVFGNLILNNISDPLGSGAFFFRKGTVDKYHYKNLSGGEKAAFDLLLDLHIKRKYYPDAIYCIDEVETHLHTALQGPLVRELAKVVPNDSQLWVTTHSLGVLRAAQEMQFSAPGSVCIIDFDGVDADIATELVPATLGRVSWEKLLSIALDDLSSRIAPKCVIVCEGSTVGTRRKDFDAEVYNRILGAREPDVLFVSGGSSQQVAHTGYSARAMLARISPNSKVVALADRDDKSLQEVRDWEANGGIILPVRNIESILFADDVIEALVTREGKLGLLSEALAIRATALSDSISRKNASDDFKSAAGQIYTGLKQLLNLQQSGNNTEAFMRDTLAPLIVPGMPSYTTLKVAILDRVL